MLGSRDRRTEDVLTDREAEVPRLIADGLTNGEIGILFESGISLGLWTAAGAMVVVPQLLRLLARRRPPAAAQAH